MLWFKTRRAQGIETEPLARIIIGLGNPGEQYARNRHNIGFMVVESLARKAGGLWARYQLSRVCRIEISGCPVLLAEPLTYMNRSGKAVDALLSTFQRKPQDLLLVVDDLNLPFGRIRIRERGTAGGHHGLESILNILETDEVVRVRMGIGEEQIPGDKSDFVLSDFPQQKQAELDGMILKAGNAIKSILSDGVSKTMAIFNA
ncbi:MAG: aminoacyl-tRNA hydrolase [Acidobacteria bacterium]|nr:aminoacyl-tRNA hydrolase [Acidobacteriota bacterium]